MRKIIVKQVFKKLVILSLLTISVFTLLGVGFGLSGCGSPHTFTADDFALHVTVEQDTLPQGENFSVDVQLRNLNERNAQIAVFIHQVWPYIYGWRYPVVPFEIPQYPHFIVIGANQFLQTTWLLGDDLESGSHDLEFRSRFYVNWGRRNQKRIEINSNVVVLNVIKGV